MWQGWVHVRVILGTLATSVRDDWMVMSCKSPSTPLATPVEDVLTAGVMRITVVNLMLVPIPVNTTSPSARDQLELLLVTLMT